MLGQVQYWMGVVEEIDDRPLRRGRIKVRIFGIHTDQTERDDTTGKGIPTEDLPWAQCVMPLTYGGISTNGTVSPPQVLKGAWVFGVTLDGDAYNTLLVLGVLPVKAMSNVATNPFESAANAITNMVKSFPKANLEFLPSDTCKDKFMKSIEDIESGSSGNNSVASSAGCYGVMQLKAQYATDHFRMAMKNEDLRKQIEASTGVSMSHEQIASKLKSDITFNRILGEGVYTYHLNTYDDPVIAALAYNQGGGACNKYLKKYGDPRDGQITYDELANKMIADGRTEGGHYIKKFLARMGKGSDPCLTNFKRS